MILSITSGNAVITTLLKLKSMGGAVIERSTLTELHSVLNLEYVIYI